MKGLRVDSRTPTFLESVIGETYAPPAGHAGVPGLEYCLVGTGISSGSITDLTKYSGQALPIFKVYKVRFKLPVCKSVLPVHSLHDGACHKPNLVGAGETIRRCIAWSKGSLLVGSGPVRRPQGFLRDY